MKISVREGMENKHTQAGRRAGTHMQSIAQKCGHPAGRARLSAPANHLRAPGSRLAGAALHEEQPAAAAHITYTQINTHRRRMQIKTDVREKYNKVQEIIFNMHSPQRDRKP